MPLERNETTMQHNFKWTFCFWHCCCFRVVVKVFANIYWGKNVARNYSHILTKLKLSFKKRNKNVILSKESRGVHFLHTTMNCNCERKDAQYNPTFRPRAQCRYNGRKENSPPPSYSLSIADPFFPLWGNRERCTVCA